MLWQGGFFFRRMYGYRSYVHGLSCRDVLARTFWSGHFSHDILAWSFWSGQFGRGRFGYERFCPVILVWTFCCERLTSDVLVTDVLAKTCRRKVQVKTSVAKTLYFFFTLEILLF